MEEFKIYLGLGFDHILDIAGADHILFVVSLAAIYRVANWKSLLILITGFTIGHTATLALSTLGFVNINADLIETLIPITIIATALLNLVRTETQVSQKLNYGLVIFFGLIHGLGFSNYLRALLSGEDDLFIPLLAFNVGLEFGQLVIVALFLLFSQLFLGVFSVSHVPFKRIILSLVIILTIYISWV